MTVTDDVVLAEGLVKRYGRTTALRGLDLTVRRGEVFGLIGPNGAGKTTTIRCLLDLVRPTGGRLEVLGTAPRAGGAELRRRVAYLPGDLRLYDRGSVDDVLASFAALRGGDRAAMRARAAELAGSLGLDRSRPVRALSKGNRQKVGIVLALMPQAELLVLDEPTSGLDPLVQQQFLDLLRAERAAGRTVLMSSHVLSEVEEVADRVGIVRDGLMVDVDDMAALRRRAARVVELRFPGDAPLAEAGALPGVSGVSAEGPVLRCTVGSDGSDGSDGSRGMPALLALAVRHGAVDLLSHAPDLEELFLTYYDRPAARAAGRGSTQVSRVG